MKSLIRLACFTDSLRSLLVKMSTLQHQTLSLLNSYISKPDFNDFVKELNRVASSDGKYLDIIKVSDDDGHEGRPCVRKLEVGFPSYRCL